jgi:hypothetical protein
MLAAHPERSVKRREASNTEDFTKTPTKSNSSRERAKWVQEEKDESEDFISWARRGIRWG